MSQQIKITEEEFSEIKMFRTKFQELIIKLGNLQVEKIELDKLVSDFVDKEKNLKEEWNSLKKLEQGILDRLAQKYGQGGLNIEDGTFTPVNPIK